MTSRVKECDANGVAAMLASATEADKPEKFTGHTMLAAFRRVLHPNPSVTEGFFASVAVLVEGETDFGVLVELARIRDLPWERLGVVVVPCGGKRSIDRPALVFREVGIPIFVLFDGDKKQAVKKPDKAAASSRQNRSIQRICGVEAPVDWPTGLAKEHPFAVFEDRIEDYFKERLGDVFEQALTNVSSDLGFKKDRTFNTREGAARVMRELSNDDLEKLTLLDEVVRAITMLAEETTKTPTAPDVQAARILSLACVT
jgi:predicted ATP-dependent endonuclease of OLD family